MRLRLIMFPPRYLVLALLLSMTSCLAVSELQPDRIIAIDSVSNLRDLGGYATVDGRTTKWRTIFRSGEFSRLSKRDQPQLSALGIQQIIDFRSQEERARSPSKWHDKTNRPETILLPIGGSAADWSSDLSHQLQTGDFSREELHTTFIDMYASIPLENAPEYAALFDQILVSQGQPLLFHCTAGKDRTGIAAALILSALDVSRDTIMQDFMATNTTVDVARMSEFLASVFSQQSGNEIEPIAIRPMLIVEPVYLETSFAVIEQQYGTVDDYLRDALGMTDSRRGELKRLLLD